MSQNDPTSRFSDRVAEYVQCRPSYPPALLPLLERECGLSSSSDVADIGSGTGILSKIFVENGNSLFAIEPNAAMRAAGEALLIGFPNFHSRSATAENTGLPDGSIDFVVAGQAFHWFDAALALPEFQRILRPGGWIILIWNERRLDATPFLAAFERLLRRWGSDYDKVAASYKSSEKLAEFLHPGALRTASFPNRQQFNWEGLRGRLLSASYVPRSGDPNYAPMMAELDRIFEEHQKNGLVEMEYDCRVYYGQPRVAKSDT